MPHLIATKKGSNKIEYLFKNGRREKGICIGDQSSPTKKASLKPSHFNFYWTEDKVVFKSDNKGGFVFDQTIDDLTLVSAPDEVPEFSHGEINLANEKINKIIRYDDSQIDWYVENNDSKVVLKFYGRVIVGLCRVFAKHLLK